MSFVFEKGTILVKKKRGMGPCSSTPSKSATAPSWKIRNLCLHMHTCTLTAMVEVLVNTICPKESMDHDG